MYSAVIFDMDGVLIDSEPANLRRLKNFLRENGELVPNLDLNQYIGRSDEESWRMLVRDSNRRRELIAGFSVYTSQYPIDFRKILRPDVVELLSYLKNQGIVIGLASAGPEWMIRQMLTECDLTGYFDTIVSGEAVALNKPAPDVYQECANRMGVAPSTCLAIEDSSNGIHAAKSAMIETWAVFHTDYEVDQSEADLILKSLGEIRSRLELDN